MKVFSAVMNIKYSMNVQNVESTLNVYSAQDLTLTNLTNVNSYMS
jgi:hypothetical protein